jgi:hypothetical protein
MDEVCVFCTSSVDCACIGSPITKCFMFSERSLNGLEHGAFYCTLNLAFRWTHINFLTFHAIQILIVIVKELLKTF